jgi:gliding motility-associated-like protein
VTISGTTTVSGTFNYTVDLTGSCGTISANGTITINPDNTITLSSAAGTDAQTLCINTAITNIMYATTGATGSTVTGLPAGITDSWAADVVTLTGTPTVSGIFNYTVTLTGGCGTSTTNGSITVTPDNTIALSSAAGTDAQTLCVNNAITDITYATTGATSASVSGLPAGVTGSWLSDVVTISGTPTASGTFNYTVTLAGGCGTITANGVITVPADNTITLSSAAGTDAQSVCENSAITDITYATTGATSVIVAGLPAGVTGSWAADVVTITGIPTASGTFNYTVALSRGCGTASANGIITVNASLPVSVSIVANANSVCAGTTVNFTAIPVNEGTTPVYQWQVNGVNAGANSTVYSYIPVNNDVVTVILTSDAVCPTGNPATSAPVTMTVHDLPVGSTTVTDVACFGQSSGSVDLAMTGGTLPFTFLWNNGATTEDLIGVIAGTYTVTITDANSCSSTASGTVNEPASALAGTITSQINVSTYGGNDGSVSVDGSGGTAPYVYSLNGGTYQGSGTFNTLIAGSYTVKVQDFNLCWVDVPVTITQPFIPLTGIISLQTDVLCYGDATGSVTVTGIDGVAPYEYCINGGTYQASGTFGTLTSGSYTVTIRDAMSNTYDVPVTILQPAVALTIVTSQSNVSCNGAADGIAVALPSGGTGTYSYSWNTTPVQVDDTAAALNPGTYTVTVTDANVCTATADVTITEPAILTLDAVPAEAGCPDSNDGSITLDINGGTPAYSVIWGDGITTRNRTSLLPDTYSVVVTDANGCAASTSTVVSYIGTFNCVVIPQIITPDPADNHNDTWIIRNIDIYPNAEVKVYSRWGKLIYHSKNPLANPWDGRYSNGRLVPTDSYHYILNLHDGSEIRSGVISVIR